MNKENIVSFAQTFLSVFLTTLITIISQVPLETLMDYSTYTTSFLIGIVVATARQTLKVLWQKFLPVSVGGVDSD